MFLSVWSKLATNCVLASIALLLGAAPAWADSKLNEVQCVETSATIKGAPLLSHMVHYRGPAGEFNAPDLQHGSRLIPPAQGDALKSSFNSGEEATLDANKSNHWFRFCLRNTSNQTHQLVVKVAPSTLSEIDFYPHKVGLPSFKTGSTKKLTTRDIPIAGFGFKVNLAPKEQQTFSLRIDASGNPFYRRANIADNPFFQATVWDRDSYDSENNTNENLFGIIVGVVLALVIYNLLLFIAARQLTSLLYIVLISSVFITVLSLSGRLVQFAPPSFPPFSNLVLLVFYPLSLFLAALFLREFIKLKNYPTLNLVGNLILGLCVLMLAVSRVYSQFNFAQVCDVVGVLIFFYFGVFASIYTLIKDRLIVSKYVLITLAPLILSLIDRALFGFGVTDQYYIPYKVVTAGMFGMILISYFMGLIAYREKQAAQRSAFEQLNISNTLKSNYNTQLEEELEQKTADIRAMNADLEQKANKLLQLDESKSKFFANISHEFRTPLTLIEGPLTMLLEREGFPEKQTLEGVVRNSNSLKRLIDQILLLSELDEKSLDLKASKIDVVQAVNEFSAQFASLFEQKGVRLSCNANQPAIQAYIDNEKLQIIVNNLLSNAIKFTEASDQVTIEISSTVVDGGQKDEYSRDEYVQIVVSDTGQGIPDKELAYVFDRYFQSDSSESSKSGLGTGIGLALVKELVELHAGEVTVQSVYEQDDSDSPTGTSFCVTLPLGRAHLSDNEIAQNLGPDTELQQALKPIAASQDSSLEPSDKSTTNKATVLVVDDNEDMRRHISRLLEDDYNIVTAADGLLAEEALSKQLPDLIVTDLMMPNRNGLEFIESIKKNSEFVNIPIIMLTARAGLDDRIQGLMAAVDDYLVKPFNGRELKVRIHNLLNKQAQFNAFYQQQGSEPQKEPINQSETYIDKVKAVVNQRLMDPDFGVDELAKALHVSEATLRRRLSDNANYTPAAFIRHCRLEKARQLSLQGNMRSISELANAVGFSKPSYFARLYQKTFNSEVDINRNSEPN